MNRKALFGAFVSGALFAYTLLPHPEPGPFMEPCSARSEWRQAPHEQQPEPMMATAGASVERWVL